MVMTALIVFLVGFLLGDYTWRHSDGFGYSHARRLAIVIGVAVLYSLVIVTAHGLDRA